MSSGRWEGINTVTWIPPGLRSYRLFTSTLIVLLLLTASRTQAEPGERAPSMSLSSQEVMQRGRALAVVQQYPQAIANYRAYLAIHPEDDEVRGMLAHVLSWQGEYDEAVKLYEDILTRHPVDVDVRIALGQVKSWQGKYPEARTIYEKILLEDPQRLEAKRGLADTLYWSGQYTLALPVYEDLLAATNDQEIAQKVRAVRAEISRVSALQVLRAPIGVETQEPSLPYRDYFKIGYSHFTSTKNIPDERNWLFEMAKPLGDRTLVARVEALDRFGFHDTLLSGEFYSPLWEKAWGYLGGALGVDPQFTPRWTAGGEIYQSLGILHSALSVLEPSFGYQRMSFRGTDIDLLSPGLTIYFPHDIWLTEKGYFVPSPGSKSLSSTLTWRISDRIQVYALGAFGTASERISSLQDSMPTDTRMLQGGGTFPLARRLSAEIWGYYEERDGQYIRRGGSLALVWHW